MAAEELNGGVGIDGTDGAVNDFEFLRAESNMPDDNEYVDACRCYGGLEPWELDGLFDWDDDCVLVVAGEVEDEAECHNLYSICGGESTVSGRKGLDLAGLWIYDLKVGSEVVAFVRRDELSIIILG